MFKKTAVLVLLVSVLATAANAQLTGPTQRAMRWDINLQTRYTGSHDYSGQGGSSASFNDDLGWGFAVAYNITDRVNVGILMSWRTVSYTAQAVDADDPGEVLVFSNWLDTGTIAVTGDFNVLPSRLTPYVSGGLGWTMIDTNVYAGAGSGCWWHPWWGYVCGYYPYTYGTDAFSYAIGAGLRLEVSQTVFLRAGYEYDGMNLDNYDGLNIFRVDLGLTY